MKKVIVLALYEAYIDEDADITSFKEEVEEVFENETQSSIHVEIDDEIVEFGRTKIIDVYEQVSINADGIHYIK